MTLNEVKQFCKDNNLVLVSQELYINMLAAYLTVNGKDADDITELPPRIKVTYDGYTGIAYGRSSYVVRDKAGKMIYHTGFLHKRPMTEEECLEELKSILDLLEMIKREKWEGKDSE